jgi:hypothetical protein
MRLGDVMKDAIGNTCLMLFLFLGTLPWTGPAVIWCLRMFFAGFASLDAFFTSIK